jgi:hypothetical protein
LCSTLGACQLRPKNLLCTLPKPKQQTQMICTYLGTFISCVSTNLGWVDRLSRIPIPLEQIGLGWWQLSQTNWDWTDMPSWG